MKKITRKTRENVKMSIYADCFDNDKVDAFILPEGESSSVFSEYIHDKAFSFWHLPDKHWMVRGKETEITDWKRLYSKNCNDVLANLLSKALDWGDNDKVYFIVARDLIIESSWKVFLENWDGFLTIDDDCPAVIKADDKSKVLFIAPLGKVFIKEKF